MFTTCPKCALNLAITAADLRIGQGYVRCGRCANVFNALVGLADDGEEVAAEPVAPVEPESDATADTQESQILVETPLVEGDPGTGTFETIVLEGDGVTQTTEVVGEDEVDEQLLALAQQIEAANADVESIPLEDSGDVEVLELHERDAEPSLTLEESLARLAPSYRVEIAQPEDEVDSNLGELSDEAAARARLLRSLTGFGCALLALLLIVQLVHHYRAQLVTVAPLTAPLTAIYATLGLSLEPHWELGAYELRQLGAQASAQAKDEILLRASVRNGASRAQPLPLLRVTLQDRFGNAIGRRDVSPPDYLRGAASRYLAPDQRVDAQITLPDPGQNAVGFEIDVCLPGARGILRCAEDAQR
jgi:predicted Zn finger-like uncharacterized protein